MFGAQGGFQQPQWQQGFNQAPYRGPPPTKKPKSNPIITRYAPPPGYKGPAHPPPPFQQPGWQQPQQTYAYGQPPYSVYQAQGYAPPQPYQQPQHPQPPYQQPPYQSFPQQRYAGLPQSYYPQTPQNYAPAPQPQPLWQQPNSAPESTAPHQPWPPSSTLNNQPRHNSAPYPASATGAGGPLDGNGDLLPPLPPQASTSDDLEDDYLNECYFSRHPDEINPDLSLGLIDWQAALPTRLPLPSTFAEAELEALAPRKQPPPDEGSISEYFVKAKRDEAFLSVRQTKAWEQLKDEIVYKEIPVSCSRILSVSELLAKYKDRPDPDWSVRAPSQTPEPELAHFRSSSTVSTNAGALKAENEVAIKSEDASDQADVLGNLEQALQENGTSHAGRYSRASSIASSQKLTRPKAVAPVRDRAQEDVLAALGVTGSPKMVFQTPGPAFGAPPPQREGSAPHTSRHNSVTMCNGLAPPPPPPPPPPPRHRHHRYGSNDPWHRDGHTNGYGTERPGSSASQHTAAGSDFHSDDQDATPRPKLNRTDSRKRGFEDSDDGVDEARRQDDDETPKQRRKQQRVNNIYSGRW